MASATLEIVELNDGRIALRHVEADEILVALEFSGNTLNFLRGHHREVARAMIDSGVHAAARLMSGESAGQGQEVPPVLH